VEAHPIYRTLDDPVSIVGGFEITDLVVIGTAFATWNMVLGFVDHINIVNILSPLLLGGLTIGSAWAWLRAREKMPRYFLQDYAKYLFLPDGLDVTPDLEVIPYVSVQDEQDDAEEGYP
jgi:hypothetical protein